MPCGIISWLSVLRKCFEEIFCSYGLPLLLYWPVAVQHSAWLRSEQYPAFTSEILIDFAILLWYSKCNWISVLSELGGENNMPTNEKDWRNNRSSRKGTCNGNIGYSGKKKKTGGTQALPAATITAKLNSIDRKMPLSHLMRWFCGIFFFLLRLLFSIQV